MFDFRKLKDVAEYLASKEGEEYDRSAISRYYYALFGSARIYLILVLGELEFVMGRNVHRRICDRLIYSSDSTEHSLGITLDKLRQIRNFADYDWETKDSSYFEEKLDFVKKESRIGLEQIEALKNSPPLKL